LKDVEQITGADSETYGPFKLEDIATIPNENAQELIIKNLAVKIHIDK
jgi:DNA replication factor GINS